MKQLPFIIMFLFVFMISGNCPANESVQHKITIESDAKDKDNHQESKENIEWASAHDMNVRLGKGINIGNTFEAMKSWQSPYVAADLKSIADLGFTHVRLPIRWERDDRSMSTAPYTIYPEFFNIIQSVVDEALKNKLHIIINMHHHDALMANSSEEKARFLSQWEQIGSFFKNYPDSVLFEILNEPHGQLTPSLWNDYSKEALQVIRNNNPKRCVLIGTAEWGGVNGLRYLEIPNDPQIILTIHYYNPFHFTHQGASWSEGSESWVGNKWEDTESERRAVIEDFEIAIKVAKEKNIPVHVGEFGSYSRADLDSRVKWTRFLSRWFEQQQFSWSYWEWNSGFGIYDPQTGQYLQRLVNALINDPMSDF